MPRVEKTKRNQKLEKKKLVIPAAIVGVVLAGAPLACGDSSSGQDAGSDAGTGADAETTDRGPPI